MWVSAAHAYRKDEISQEREKGGEKGPRMEGGGPTLRAWAGKEDREEQPVRREGSQEDVGGMGGEVPAPLRGQ